MHWNKVSYEYKRMFQRLIQKFIIGRRCHNNSRGDDKTRGTSDIYNYPPPLMMNCCISVFEMFKCISTKNQYHDFEIGSGML